jgi:hypothetical protein
VALLRAERGESEVVEDQDVGLGPAGEQPRVGAVATCELKLLDEARDAAVDDRVAIAARLLPERTREASRSRSSR